MWKVLWLACLTPMPYWGWVLRPSPPNTLTTHTRPSGERYMRWVEWRALWEVWYLYHHYSACTGVERLNHIQCHFTLFCILGIRLRMFIFIHGHMRPQSASIQIALSVYMFLCVSGTSGYSPWSAWSGIGGGGIWQRHRPGWFPGQVYMHSSCLFVCVPMLNLTLSPFICQLSWPPSGK